jgi:hypothetical protein
MLFYKDEEDYKKGIEENIKWNEDRIKSIKEGIKTQKGWRKRTSDAELIKSIQSGITHSEDTIRSHQGFIANSQKRYVELTGNRYGAQKLKVIQGGRQAIV